MSEKKKLRRTLLFGYSKKATTEYINQLISDYEKLCEEQTAEIAEVKKQNQTLMSENAESFKKLEELENEREYVSKAVISAELRAKKVMEDTEKEMAVLKANKAAELAMADDELAKLREQIKNLKLSAVETLRRYEAQMDNLIEEEK